MDIHERRFMTKINHNDRAKLTRLTSNTLFCRSCFAPIHEEKYNDELTSPFVALTDIISALLLPIALIPLLFILPILIMYEIFYRWAHDEYKKNKDETSHNEEDEKK